MTYPEFSTPEFSKYEALRASVSVPEKLAFPSTVEWLSEGGDARISLKGQPASNQYGCRPFPDASLISFSSSTASVISESAFTAADALRNWLAIAVEADLPEVVYGRELNRIKHELLGLVALDDLDGLEVVFGASGTDLHLIAAQLCHTANQKSPMLAIMPDSMETGSGVPAALLAKHFSSITALGEAVIEGAAIEKLLPIHVASVAMRFADGNLRPEALVDDEVEAMVEHAVELDQHILLIMVDTSKTGLISPSLPCVMKLKQRYPEFVDVLVDACQFRISDATLRAYLEHDFIVMVTGSKFISGPTFSGALFIPKLSAIKLLSKPLASGLNAYSAQAEWPKNCLAAQSLKHIANFGLLLRWQAAIVELKHFKSVPDIQIASFNQRFANAIQNRLKNDERFEQIAVRPIHRFPLAKDEGWDNIPTMFSFILYRDRENGAKQALTHLELLEIYQRLQSGANDLAQLNNCSVDTKVEVLRCQLGQPVFYATYNGQAVSALRLCLSARLIVEASINHGENANKMIQRALSVLDYVGELVGLLPEADLVRDEIIKTSDLTHSA